MTATLEPTITLPTWDADRARHHGPHAHLGTLLIDAHGDRWDRVKDGWLHNRGPVAWRALPSDVAPYLVLRSGDGGGMHLAGQQGVSGRE